jgi:hypothetical protein
MGSGKPTSRAAGSERLVGSGMGKAAGRRALLAALSLLAIAVSGFAQTPDDIRVFLQDEPIVEGERFDVFVEIPREYQSGLRARATPDNDRMRRWFAGPSYVYTSSEYEIPEDRFLAQFNFIADVAGYASYDGFVLTWPEVEIETGEILIPITADGQRIPPELEWNFPSEPIFEGQTVYLSLDMHRVKEIVFPETLSIETPRDAILEEVTGLGELTEYEYAGESFNRIPLATFLYTPLRSGRLPIPPASVSFNNYERRVRGENISVEAISDTASIESGAVGIFELITSDPPRRITEGDELVFVLSIRGEGSLGVLQLPDIDVVNATIEGRDQVADYRPTENGYAGSQSRSYRIRPDSPGSMQIIVPEFSWFNPLRGEAVVESSRTFTINVEGKVETGEKDPVFSELFYPSGSGLSAYLPLNLSASLLGIALFATVPLYLLLYFTLTRRLDRRNRMGLLAYFAISLAAIAFISSNLISDTSLSEGREAFLDLTAPLEEQALEEGRTLAADLSWDNELLFHLAQAEYDAGNQARSLVLIRQAVSNEPMNGFMRQALALLEGEMELNRQFSIPRIPHEDLAVGLLFLCLLTSAIVLSAKDFRPRWNASFLIYVVLFALVFVSSSTMYVMYRQNRGQQMAVIREGGVMVKKIPDPDAENWIFLPQGTTVDTRVENAGFIQIETAYGIVAWIPVEGVYRDD